MFTEKHSQRSEQQENAEQVANTMKPTHQRDAAQDHDSAHDQRAENSPHQRAMLRPRRDAEISKNQYENEDVINAQRIFDEESSKKIEAGFRSFNVPDEPIKSKRYQHPQYGPLRGRRGANCPPSRCDTTKASSTPEERA